MKKYFFAFPAFLLFAVGVAAQSVGGGCNEGRARGAALANQEFQACIHNYLPSPNNFADFNLSVSQDPDGLDPCAQIVYATLGPSCNGPGPCPLFPTIIVAAARIDGNYNVVDVTCF